MSYQFEMWDRVRIVSPGSNLGRVAQILEDVKENSDTKLIDIVFTNGEMSSVCKDDFVKF